MKVQLISCTADAVNVVKVGTLIKESKDRKEYINNNENNSFNYDEVISQNIKNNDLKAFNNVYFTFLLEGISATAETYITAHNLSSFIVDANVNYTPDDVEIPNFKYESDLDSNIAENLQSKYALYCKEAIDTYNFLVGKGIFTIDASNVLPNSLKHDVIISGTLKQLGILINDSETGRESKNDEIVDLGNQLLNFIKEKFPDYVEAILKKLEYLKNDNIDKINELLKEEDINCDIEDKNSKLPVELISYTENAEQLIGISALIARINCSTAYAKVKTNDTEFLKKLLANICTEKNARELEMVNYTFRINNLTFATLRKILINKIGSVCIQTISETEKSNFYKIPDSIANSNDEEIINRYNEIFEESKNIYKKFTEYGLIKQYKMYLYLKGDYVMDAIITMNTRQLYNFFTYSTCVKTSSDIRDIAQLMLDKLNEVSPFIFFNAGPSCFKNGVCIFDKECEEREKIVNKIIE